MTKDVFDLKGKVVAVTGGLGQLGKSFTRALHAHGAKVAVLDVTEPTQAWSDEFDAHSADIAFFQTDVTDKSSLQAALEFLRKTWNQEPYGLINNAALDSPPNAPAEENGPFETYPESSFDKIMEVNVKGVFLACQTLGAAMAEAGRGSIVNIASTYGILSPCQDIYEYRRQKGETFFKPVAYSVSKSALLNLTRYLSTYWADKGVLVNTLTFGGVFNGQDQTFLEEYAKRTPLGRMASEKRIRRSRRLSHVRRRQLHDRLEHGFGRRLVRLVISPNSQDRRPFLPSLIPNWINGKECAAASGAVADKLSPVTGEKLYSLAASNEVDVNQAVQAAMDAQPDWGATPAVERGLVLLRIVDLMQRRHEELADMVHRETGKSLADASGEVNAAIQQGLFWASEGQRLYGKTCQTAVPNRFSMTVRAPVGVAGLIIAANTPIANVAWKIFPAILCGNGCVLKAAEDTPGTAWLMGELCRDAGLPDGVLNVIQGLGPDAGQPLVEHRDVGVVSFTGSAGVGKILGRICGDRLAKVSLELGGKNALVVCDDADIDNAVKWTALSAFSNAGQRCVAGSRIIVFEAVYDRFKEALLEMTRGLTVGPEDTDDFGPVINERQLMNMCDSVSRAVEGGATLLAGGERMTDQAHVDGFYMPPTILEGVAPDAALSQEEVFGPITCLYKASDFEAALKLVNASQYGLSACIHTKNLDRAMEFCTRAKVGVAVVNAGTFGSEPHMPFGGAGDSGNGSREPGTEAVDIYSDLKTVYIHTDKEAL